ncbi:MAG: hypothetical protein WC983_05445 [Tissierellaceae bacterium]
MKDISRGSLIRLINIAVLLMPMSFLFHYLETSIPARGSTLAFLGAFLFIVLAGIVSINLKLIPIILISTLSIFLSIALGNIFIISPNESWFNPFGMNFAIIFAGIIILIGILIIRLFARKIFK